MVDELSFTEDFEEQVILIKTNKRKEKIKIFVPLSGFAHWKISYENGKEIPELNGVYLSRLDAIKAVTFWLQKTKISEKAKHDAWFKPEKERPELKRKKAACQNK